MSQSLLSLQGVHTHIAQYHILHGVDLNVAAGQVTVLLGRNGAGKTTCLRTIMGLWRASAGSIRLREQEITQWETPAIARDGIAYVPENMGIFAELTVQQNILLAASRKGIDQQRLDWVFGFFPALKKFWHYPAGNLSGGQKQMLAIARAMIEPRQLILVDEPSKGLAPAIIDNMLQAFRELKASQTTILIVEQNFNFVRDLGDQVAVMDDGKIVHQGKMAALAADDDLQQRLLGLSLASHQ